MIYISGYDIKEKIYQGKNTILYRGIRTQDNKAVILKTLNKEYPSVSDIEQLKHEYEINKIINSNNIVKSYAIETYERKPVLILEDFYGVSLDNILSSRKKLELMDFLEIAIKLSEILVELSKNCIIHKDVNPSNIIVDIKNGIVKLCDFGIATTCEEEKLKVNILQPIRGTLHYISPEQTGRVNRGVDYSSDFYSLGVTLYKMITGKLPFDVCDELGIIHCHIAIKPTSPNDIDENIPKVVSDIIMKLLEKTLEDRYKSAIAIKSDLERCKCELQENGQIYPFEIATNDFSDKFLISDKLYGREKEVKILTDIFQRICNGKSEVTMVTGSSGIGKSALVNELRKTVIKNGGYFISGKFDELKLDIPYSALIKCLKQLIQQVLFESRESVKKWRSELLKQLGGNGQIIINVIPEIEKIIGKQPEVLEMQGEEGKNRFNRVFLNFMKAFFSQEHPIVLFLDDLQWADISTLKFLEVLVHDFKYVMLIGAFRDNEVNEEHPLKTALKNMIGENIRINEIYLNSMTMLDIRRLLVDTFQQESNEIALLSEICDKKTGGNPFFIRQFLQSLFIDRLIIFNRDQWKWQWNLPGIENYNVTDNVVQLISKRIETLSKETKEILQLASCIGIKFDLLTLATVQGKTTRQCYDDIWEAVVEGLVSISKDVGFIDEEEYSLLSYNFIHDGIRQSAYSLIEEKVKCEMHLKIGRVMLSKISDLTDNNIYLDVVNQLNKGIDLISNSFEKEYIAGLELICGRLAKKENAYDAAYKYYETGINLIKENGWQRNYSLTYSLYIEFAEAAYLSGDFDTAGKYTEIIIRNSNNLLDKIKAYEVRILTYGQQNNLTKAVDTGLYVLKLQKINFPSKVKLTDVFIEYMKVGVALRRKRPEEIFSSNQKKGPLAKAISDVMIKMGAYCFITDPFLAMCIILKGIKTGITAIDPFGYVSYGMFLCIIGKIETGYEFGEYSLQLLNKEEFQYTKARTKTFFNIFISPWKEHIRNTLPRFEEAYLVGVDYGDINYGCLALFAHCYHSYYAGIELSCLQQEMEQYSETLIKNNYKRWLLPLAMFHQAVLNLREYSEDPCSLSGEIYNEAEMLPIHLKEKDKNSIFDVYINKLILCYLFSEYDKAKENAALCEKYLEGVSGTFSVPIFHFYDSLIYLASFEEVYSYEEIAIFNRNKINKRISSNQKRMKKWAKHAPANFLNKYYLVEAEKARILRYDLKAMELYNLAIKLAAKERFIQEEALANELAAKFYFSRGNLKVANAFLLEACYCYSLWGATAKVKQLKKKFTKVFNRNLDRLSGIKNLETKTLNSISNSSIVLDTAAILKATQAISGEIILDELLKKLVTILLENAGAERVVYIEKEEDKHYIKAEGIVENSKIEIMSMKCMEEECCVPKKIIYYVEHSKESIVLDNAYNVARYSNDAYINKNKCKSIMCMPVISKGYIIGLLYLENNLIEGAFSMERVEILKVISTQLAISLENAVLYNNLEALVENRTIELKKEIMERKKAQRLLEEAATHDHLTGLANRKLFQDQLNTSIELANKGNYIISVLFIDLDGFKAINDNLGHDSGDVVLKVVAERLLKCLGPEDLVARLGGDEFAILLNEVEYSSYINFVCHNIISEVQKPINLCEKQGHVTASIGVSIFPKDGNDSFQLIKKADDAMYIAKKRGKNQFVINNTM